MKKALFITFALLSQTFCFAQKANVSQSHFVISFDGIGGLSSTSFQKQAVAPYYDLGVNEGGTWKLSSSASLGGQATFTYFFGKKCKIGVGTGYSFQTISGELSIENFKIDYREFDSFSRPFRQSVVSDKISEKLNTQIHNIPVFMSGRLDLGDNLELVTKGGILIPVSSTIKYTTDAVFDMNAYYKFAGGGVNVYDNGINDGAEWILSKDAYATTTTNVYSMDDSLRTRGYKVNWGLSANSKSGSMTLKAKGVGFFIHPEIGLKMSDNLTVQLGVNAAMQSFDLESPASYKIIDLSGNYTTPLKLVKTLDYFTYGINIGVKFRL